MLWQKSVKGNDLKPIIGFRCDFFPHSVTKSFRQLATPAPLRSNCAENIRKHILHTGKHEGVKMYNCPKCTHGTNSPMEFRNHLKENHPDIENPDLAYLHAACGEQMSVTSSLILFLYKHPPVPTTVCVDARGYGDITLCPPFTLPALHHSLSCGAMCVCVCYDDVWTFENSAQTLSSACPRQEFPRTVLYINQTLSELQTPLPLFSPVSAYAELIHINSCSLDIRDSSGIVCKSFECRLKGQGATFVETMDSPVHRKGTSEEFEHDEQVQQVIIIQGYGGGEVSIDQALEESAAATLQTLAMAGQVAEVLHITEDGQVIASGREVASGGAHLAGDSTQFVVLESGEAREELGAVGRVATAGKGHSVSESSTALDALLSAVSEMGHQEETQGEATVIHEVLTPEMAEVAQSEVRAKQEQENVRVIREADREGMQEVLQLAASQMMKEGVTQVIVNDEGTHYIVTELDNCTLQVEEGVYGEAGEGEVQQAEQQAAEEMVVYLDGAPHNLVLEG
ncbi:hypothetical protein F2P81_001629 [Scophthalmus maximus]|uniref:Zinc finger protein 407 n=1 Tax=Scophthalmus maximus TaxID=52904 RepID=A0A6A4TND1_SCOMX|nr:hypothetical protein F2P81_001629 [Scophthalmus maximus]